MNESKEKHQKNHAYLGSKHVSKILISSLGVGESVTHLFQVLISLTWKY